MHVLPLAFGLSVAALTVWRWGDLGWPGRAATAALCGVLFVYGTGFVHLPEPQALVDTLGLTLGPYTYVLVGVMAFLETAALVGLIVPGETLVIVGGVVAGQGHLDVVALIALTWACALCGDLSGYALGRRLGRPFLLERGPRLHITERRLIQVESWFAGTAWRRSWSGGSSVWSARSRRSWPVRPATPAAGSRRSRWSARPCGAPRARCSASSCGSPSIRRSRSRNRARSRSPSPRCWSPSG